jgi:hypothetical protein
MCGGGGDGGGVSQGEWEEWGNPNERDYFEYMKQYCPYSNVAAQVGRLDDVNHYIPAKYHLLRTLHQ